MIVLTEDGNTPHWYTTIRTPSLIVGLVDGDFVGPKVGGEVVDGESEGESLGADDWEGMLLGADDVVGLFVGEGVMGAG